MSGSLLGLGLDLDLGLRPVAPAESWLHYKTWSPSILVS